MTVAMRHAARERTEVRNDLSSLTRDRSHCEPTALLRRLCCRCHAMKEPTTASIRVMPLVSPSCLTAALFAATTVVTPCGSRVDFMIEPSLTGLSTECS